MLAQRCLPSKHLLLDSVRRLPKGYQRSDMIQGAPTNPRVLADISLIARQPVTSSNSWYEFFITDPHGCQSGGDRRNPRLRKHPYRPNAAIPRLRRPALHGGLSRRGRLPAEQRANHQEAGGGGCPGKMARSSSGGPASPSIETRSRAPLAIWAWLPLSRTTGQVIRPELLPARGGPKRQSRRGGCCSDEATAGRAEAPSLRSREVPDQEAPARHE